MISTVWLIVLLIIIGVITITISIKWSRYYTLQIVKEWMSKMDRKTWVIEELNNAEVVDYAIGNLIARKRMEKLAKSDSINECRIVVVFNHGAKQYKCSGVLNNSKGEYIRPKGEWFTYIAKESIKQSGFKGAKIITRIVMSPEL